MAYYEVIVEEKTYKIDAPSIVYAARGGRDAWRDGNRQKTEDESFKMPEPLTVHVKMISSVGAKID